MWLKLWKLEKKSSPILFGSFVCSSYFVHRFSFGFGKWWKRWRRARRNRKHEVERRKDEEQTDHWERSNVCRVEKEHRRDLIKTASFFVMLHEDVLLTDHFSQSGFHCAWLFFFRCRKGYDNCYGNIQMNNFYLFVPILRSVSCFHSCSLIPNHLLECNATTWTRARTHTIHFRSLFAFFSLYGDNRRTTLRFSPTAKLHKGIPSTHTHKERKKSF